MVTKLHTFKDAEPEKLKLGIYPYTYARISAMKGKLVKKDDYIRMLKMDTASIVRFLEETEYKQSVDKLAASYRGVELAEQAINDHLVTFVKKLKAISAPEVVELLDAYLKRWDVYNLKTVLRIKNRNVLHAEHLLIPLGGLDKKTLLELLQLPSFSDVIKRIQALGYKLKEAEKANLASLENQLDRDFYYKTLKFANRIPEEGEGFKRFLQMEIDVLNIRNLLKLKKINATTEMTTQFLIVSGQYLGPAELKKLAATRNVEELIDELKKTKYNSVVEQGTSIVDIELALDKFWLQESSLYSHQNPLSVQSILAYMLALDIEARNLKAIVRGKQLRLKEEFIETKLLLL